MLKEDVSSVVFLDLLENTDDLSDCKPEIREDVSAVLVVTDVLVSPSVVTKSCEDVSSVLDWERVEL